MTYSRKTWRVLLEDLNTFSNEAQRLANKIDTPHSEAEYSRLVALAVHLKDAHADLYDILDFGKSI